MSNLVGEQLGQYEIIEEIARGGMATVYRAHQRSIGRDIAIKLMPRSLTFDETFLQRFNREVEIIAQLQHPHILPIYDYGEYDGMPFIAMAYLSGGTLEDRIIAGDLSIPELLRTLRQIANALDFAHGKGIIHRDFKPANVLLDEQGNTYLADFGLARVTETNSNLTGMSIVGTPTHMAPELASPDELTPAVDIYALGITIYQLLTGKVPFEANSASGILMAHVTQPVPDIRQIRPDLPDTVQPVIAKALAKKVKDRYNSAKQLVDDLTVALDASASTQSATTGEELTALLMTNMLGRVIFVDNQCLRILKRHQRDARNIIGKPLHEVLGTDPKVAQQLIDIINQTGQLDETAIDITDSRGTSWAVTCSAIATRDDDGNYVGADVTLSLAAEYNASGLPSGIDSAPKAQDTREEHYLEDYFKSQVEALHKLLKNWAGKKVSRYLEDIINETGERNVWPVSMADGHITVQLSRSDTDIYRAVLARAISYTANLVGDKIVVKEMQRVNKKTDPAVLQFVRHLGLDETYKDILE